MRLIRASDHPEAQSIPVIAMTANVFVKDVHDALDAGMNAHIAKPLNLETLKSALGSCLSKNKTAEKIPRNIEQLVRFAREFLTCLHFNTYSALRQSVRLNIFPQYAIIAAVIDGYVICSGRLSNSRVSAISLSGSGPSF